MKNFPKKIAVIGVGLIGGSIALGLKKHFGPTITILGSCSDRKRAHLAKNNGLIDIVLDEDSPLSGDVELIILATPVFSILKLLKFLSRNAPVNSLVIDVGSTKQVICKQAKRLLPSTVSFIGTHPMAGSEASGFENASVNLFRNKPWIICPTKKNSKEDLLLVKQLIKILAAKPTVITPFIHDRVTAWASHLPLTLSSILVKTVADQKIWPEVRKIASTGFRDSTRLASYDTKIKKDIIFTNKKNLINSLLKVKVEIDCFISLIKKEKNTMLLEYLQNAKSIRDQMLTNS